MANEGGSIQGTMVGDAAGADIKRPGLDDPFAANSAMLQDFSRRSALAQKDELPFQEIVKSGATITYGPDGLSFKGLDPRLVVGMMEKSKRLDTIMGAMAQEQERLQAQQAQLDTTGGRIGNVLSRLAGNMSQQNDMPGWVKGAGKTALEFNPSREELVARQMKLGEEEAQIGASQQRILEARLRAEEIGAYHAAETQRKAEHNAATEAAKKRELEIDEERRKDRAQADRDKAEARVLLDRRKNLERVLNEGKAAGGRISAAELAKLNPEDRAEANAVMKGIRENEDVKAQRKLGLQTARLEARSSQVAATNSTRMAIAQVGKMNQSAKEGLLAKVAKDVFQAEEAHARLVMATQDNFMTDEGQKVEHMKLLQAAERNLTELKAQYEELKKKAQPSGPTMSSPEAAAKAAAPAGPKKLIYNKATDEFE